VVDEEVVDAGGGAVVVAGIADSVVVSGANVAAVVVPTSPDAVWQAATMVAATARNMIGRKARIDQRCYEHW